MAGIVAYGKVYKKRSADTPERREQGEEKEIFWKK
jgi:hypothetical protein